MTVRTLIKRAGYLRDKARKIYEEDNTPEGRHASYILGSFALLYAADAIYFKAFNAVPRGAHEGRYKDIERALIKLNLHGEYGELPKLYHKAMYNRNDLFYRSKPITESFLKNFLRKLGEFIEKVKNILNKYT